MGPMNYDQWKKEIKERSRSLHMIRIQDPRGRGIRTKPRDPEELRMLMQLALKRREQALNSGEYEIISPRRWRIHDPK